MLIIVKNHQKMANFVAIIVPFYRIMCYNMITK